MMELFLKFIKRFKEKNFFMRFLKEEIASLIREIYKRYSGQDVEKSIDQMLRLKNNRISKMLLLAKLLGEKLIKIHETINDYEKTSDKEADKLIENLISELKRVPKKRNYLNMDENLKSLSQSYEIY